MDQRAHASHSRCPYAELLAPGDAAGMALVGTAQAPVAQQGTVDLAVGAADGPAHVPGAKCPAKRWGTRAGVAVFAFFLIKGLAWLVVPAAIAAFAMKGD